MNPRILGAFVVGAGLIGLSYYSAVDSNQMNLLDPANTVVAGSGPERSYIAIQDSNNNNIPDWRENLKEVKTISFPTATSTATYTVPDTLTAEFAIDLFQDLIRKDAYAPFGGTREEIIAEAEEKILAAGSDKLFVERDITIIKDYSNEDLKAYGNKVAEIAQIHSISSEIENEAVITRNAVVKSDPKLLEPLGLIEESYQGMLDQMLLLPVPESLFV
jgi:hypothetical protein